MTDQPNQDDAVNVPEASAAADVDTARRPECDVVMKGGITSGIVYPRLIVELSRKYRFRQIGGASAGAIAATMTAAAQAGQLKETPVNAGDTFAQLAKIPTELANSLSHLFQPSPKTAVAYDALMAVLKPDRHPAVKFLALVWLVIRRGFGWFALATLVAMVPAISFVVALLGVPANAAQWCAFDRALLVWLPVALAIGIVVAAVVVGRSALKAAIDNGFGICDGQTKRKGAPIDPLTRWMDKKLKTLAGPLDHDPDDRPVCFKDLWGEKATAAYCEALNDSTGESGELAELTPTTRRELRDLRAVDCLVITTDLSHQRPYQFPFDTAEFFWCRECMEKYFPQRVVNHMESASGLVPATMVPNGKPTCSIHAGKPLRFMPPAPEVPLVLAPRLSLSFPGLISAVPFQAADRNRQAGNQNIVTVWFSDGGISSNFPMRFFDSVWPQRPTFGINLVPPHQDYPKQMVWRPPPGQGGLSLRHTPITSWGGFAGAIFNSARNWADTTQIAMPGFRDRVVEVRQRPDEGGMNLQMPDHIITGLAERGTEAGRNIVYGDGGTQPFNFNTHRWMRYRNAMASLDELLTGMRTVWTGRPDSQLEFLTSDVPKPGFPPRRNDLQATATLMAAARDIARLGHPATGNTVPHPEPDLRLIPPL